MNILITGGSGFIGSEIVNQLFLNGGYEITVLDSMTEQIHGEKWEESYLYKRIKGKCQFIKGDIRDIEIVKRAIVGNEVIIHLAAETGTGQSMYEMNKYNEVNVLGTSNILQVIAQMGKKKDVKKIILSSSRSVYGEGKYNCKKCGVVYPRNRSKGRMTNGDFNLYCPYCENALELLPTNEDSEIRPASIYAFTKYAQEMMIRTICPSLELEYTIFRFQNVYGVGQSLRNPYTGILSVFSSLLLENKTLNIFEDGKESRDFINVRDVASTVVRSISNQYSNGEIINIGSGINTSVYEIAKMLKKQYHSESEIRITKDFRLGDIAHSIADISKAKKLLNFSPTISLDEGIKEFCSWTVKQERDCSGYQQSLSEMEKAGLFIRGDRQSK